MKVEDTTRQEFEYANAMPRNLFKALAEFQQEVPTIHKGTKGYGYTYADLPAIFEVINPLLKKHGLGFTQLMQGNSLETIVFHCESGERLTSLAELPQDIELKGMNAFQVAGSSITYFRRYALSSALGLVTDKDADAGGEQEPKKAEQNKPEPKPNLDEELFNLLIDNMGKQSEKWGCKITVEQIEKRYKISKDYKDALEIREKETAPPIITDAEFEEEKEALSNKTVTLEQIKTKYVLSTVQEKALMLIAGLG